MVYQNTALYRKVAMLHLRGEKSIFNEFIHRNPFKNWKTVNTNAMFL